MADGGRTGASLGDGVEQSAQRKKRAAEKRKREEKRSAKRSGPVTVRFVDPATLRPPVRKDQDDPA